MARPPSEEKSMDIRKLYTWCSIPADELESHPGRKVPFRMVKDSAAMGELMARELVDEIKKASSEGRMFRAIIPCGPSCWYAPYVRLVKEEKVSLRHVVIFHMDECLDWQGRTLPAGNPYNFRAFMEKHFYGGIPESLAVPQNQRFFLSPESMFRVAEEIAKAPVDYCLGGWGQDGHIAYNQARRNPYSQLSVEELRNSTIRIQDNNTDTIMALAQRTFGAGYEFVPPMSITLGIKECLGARKVRLFSDTGAWKQTALRVALFSEKTAEYPMTLLQDHPDALLTATRETAEHPVSLHPEWEFPGLC